jgi:hypothetical protein
MKNLADSILERMGIFVEFREVFRIILDDTKSSSNILEDVRKREASSARHLDQEMLPLSDQ